MPHDTRQPGLARAEQLLRAAAPAPGRRAPLPVHGGAAAGALAGAPPPRRGYYARACRYCALSETERAAVGLHRNRRAEQQRIRRLGAAWGERLDALGASARMVVWVADASAPRDHAQRELRYRGVVAMLERWRAGEAETDDAGAVLDLRRRFERLRASLPKVGRQAEDAPRKKKARRP